MERYLEGHKIPPPGDASPLSTSGQSAESYEDETQFSDSGGIDTCVMTYLSFDPVKRALFDNSSRQFWNFYNKLSIPDWSVPRSKHGTYAGASSSTRGTGISTSTTPDSQESSNAASSLLTPKRKKRGDDDETSNNRSPPKTSQPRFT